VHDVLLVIIGLHHLVHDFFLLTHGLLLILDNLVLFKLFSLILIFKLLNLRISGFLPLPHPLQLLTQPHL
jgi:hypothetical protein